MRPIPIELRKRIASNPFMQRCIYWGIRSNGCKGRVEWEHAFEYGGKQINEEWAIVPVCTYHHRIALDKDYNRFRAIIRADIDDLQRRMPKKNWRQIKKYLVAKYA